MVDGWVHRYLEQRSKDVVNHILHAVYASFLLVNRVQSRNLNNPSEVWVLKFIFDDPLRLFVPLRHAFAINRDARLEVNMRVGLTEHVVCDFRNIFSLDIVVCFEEDRPEDRLPEGTVFGSEPIKSLVQSFVSLNIEKVQVKVLGLESKPFRYVFQCKGFLRNFVKMNYFVWAVSELLPHELK